MTDEISAARKRTALRSILDSRRLANADRLQGFLTYIVDEDIAGRGGEIRGKTIAQDVYGKDPAQGTDPENIVRVDARRLRQTLELYYQGEGRADPVYLHLDPGSYRPWFESKEEGQLQPSARSLRRYTLPAAFFAAGALIGAITVNFLTTNRPDVIAVSNTVKDPVQRPIQTSDLLRRAAIYDKSPSALQAFNLAAQARDMIFPIFDKPRQKLVLTVFEHVIELDPDYYGGYAGASQALATLAIITPPGPRKIELSAAALFMADKAVTLAPDVAWSQSAQSWALLASGSYHEAVRVGRRAALIDPDDSHVLDFFGAVALFSGEFETAIEISERDFHDEARSQRSVNRNVSGAAHFHLGNYATSIARFQKAAEYGDPLSAASLAYVTAAHFALGSEAEARVKLAELEEAWPNAPVGQMLRGIHKDPANAEAVMSNLKQLGWRGRQDRP